MEEKRGPGRPKGTPKVKLSLRLNQELIYEDLESYAAQRGCAVSRLVGEALSEMLAAADPDTYRPDRDFIRYRGGVQRVVRGGSRIERNASKLMSVYITEPENERLEQLLTKLNAKVITKWKKQDVISMLLWDWLETR